MRMMSSYKKLILWVFFAVCVVILFFYSNPVHVFIVDQYENVMYALFPSPARAFRYGERHFNGNDPADYDISRAHYFFELASKDPMLPYVYHELARISFLESNFTLAMAQIDFQIAMHGDSEPNSYYIRGLIEGYMGDYKDAVTDYAHYLQFDPEDWAAINDYAWVLLKDDQPQKAVEVTSKGLSEFAGNPWLLNTNATALYEVGDLTNAYRQATLAVATSKTITQNEWLTAYPGNDPGSVEDGIETFQQAALSNMHTIQNALASSAVQ